MVQKPHQVIHGNNVRREGPQLSLVAQSLRPVRRTQSQDHEHLRNWPSSKSTASFIFPGPPVSDSPSLGHRDTKASWLRFLSVLLYCLFWSGCLPPASELFCVPFVWGWGEANEAQELIWNSAKETCDLFTPERWLPTSDCLHSFGRQAGGPNRIWVVWWCGTEDCTQQSWQTSPIWRILLAMRLDFVSCPQIKGFDFHCLRHGGSKTLNRLWCHLKGPGWTQQSAVPALTGGHQTSWHPNILTPPPPACPVLSSVSLVSSWYTIGDSRRKMPCWDSANIPRVAQVRWGQKLLPSLQAPWNPGPRLSNFPLNCSTSNRPSVAPRSPCSDGKVYKILLSEEGEPGSGLRLQRVT